MLTAKIDFIQATGVFCIDHLDSTLNLIRSFGYSIEYQFKKSIYLGKRFDHSFSSCVGVRGGFNLVSSGVSAVISFSGQFFSTVDQWQFIEKFSKLPWRLTRLDIALDDYDRRVSFSQVRDLAISGNYALCENYKYIESATFSRRDPVPTLYFGAPTSNKLIRFYDAEFMHGINADRWEVQFRRLRAVTAWEHILENFGDPNAALASQLTGSIDFIDRTESTRLDRCSRYRWWDSLCKEAGRVTLSPVYPPKSLEKTFDWLERTVSTSLAIFHQAYGDQFLQNLTQMGKEKFTTYHRSCVEQLKSELQNIGA